MEVIEHSLDEFEHVVLASLHTVHAEYLTQIGNRCVSVSVVEAPCAACAEWIITQQLRADGLQPIRVTASA